MKPKVQKLTTVVNAGSHPNLQHLLQILLFEVVSCDLTTVEVDLGLEPHKSATDVRCLHVVNSSTSSNDNDDDIYNKLTVLIWRSLITPLAPSALVVMTFTPPAADWEF